MLPQKTRIGKMRKMALNIAKGVRILPKLFVFKFCTALTHKNRRKWANKCQNVLPSGEVK